MDPKHQFAAQIMLSRANAERREQIEKFSHNSRGNSPTSENESGASSPVHLSENNNNLNENDSNNNNNPVRFPGPKTFLRGFLSKFCLQANSLGNYNGKLSVNEVNSHLQQAFVSVLSSNLVRFD
jgi:hypothetical protein